MNHAYTNMMLESPAHLLGRARTDIIDRRARKLGLPAYAYRSGGREGWIFYDAKGNETTAPEGLTYATPETIAKLYIEIVSFPMVNSDHKYSEVC